MTPALCSAARFSAGVRSLVGSREGGGGGDGVVATVDASTASPGRSIDQPDAHTCHRRPSVDDTFLLFQRPSSSRYGYLSYEGCAPPPLPPPMIDVEAVGFLFVRHCANDDRRKSAGARRCENQQRDWFGGDGECDDHGAKGFEGSSLMKTSLPGCDFWVQEA
uniref:Uncharacterized protein n=1 Tax=Steinernema glaseri TaxID=37863 RepID=A0A1I8AQ94_9BILA